MATVLLADDDEKLLQMYSLWLEEAGSPTLRTATTGREALEQIDESVDVAVLDRGMPELTGDKVAATIRSTHPDCTILVVSAFEPDDGIEDWAYDRYVTKPIEREELATMVDDAAAGRLGSA